MLNEFEVEPDYYIDRAPDAIFIPNPEGETKATQIFDEDPDLFDYEREVEPILQVLVGKSIEHARIEVIEEYEKEELLKHKRRFFQLKEAELMETQKLEEVRIRRNDEADRRNLQMRTAKNQNVAAEKKILARLHAKKFLQFFKRDSLNTLIDLGALRRPRDYGVGIQFVPRLYNQVRSDMQAHHNNHLQLDQILNDSMKVYAVSHKQAI